MERGLSHIVPIVLRGEHCSYVGGKRRTQIKNMPQNIRSFTQCIGTIISLKWENLCKDGICI